MSKSIYRQSALFGNLYSPNRNNTSKITEFLSDLPTKEIQVYLDDLYDFEPSDVVVFYLYELLRLWPEDKGQEEAIAQMKLKTESWPRSYFSIKMPLTAKQVDIAHLYRCYKIRNMVNNIDELDQLAHPFIGPHVQRLDIEDILHFNEQSFKNLLASEFFQPKELWMKEIYLKSDVIDRLFTSPVLNQLEKLQLVNLEKSTITENTFKVLAEREIFPIKYLTLENIPSEGIIKLFKSSHFANLVSISLSKLGESWDEVLQQIAKNKGQLKRLFIKIKRKEGLGGILESPVLHQLEKLHFEKAIFGEKEVDQLLSQGELPQMKSLIFSGNILDKNSAKKILNSNSFPNLEQLAFCKNDYFDESFYYQILDSALVENLTKLSLGKTPIIKNDKTGTQLFEHPKLVGKITMF